jgi:hypothetical protein
MSKTISGSKCEGFGVTAGRTTGNEREGGNVAATFSEALDRRVRE